MNVFVYIQHIHPVSELLNDHAIIYARMKSVSKQFAILVRKVVVFLIEDVNMYVYGAVFLVVVFGLAWVYYILTPYGHGIGQSAIPHDSVTYSHAVYFSIVTVSTLGYGNLYPIGISKAVSCLEVLFGLSFFGIVIAKITSRRLSYHVQRLFSSDAKKRLEEYSRLFEKGEDDLRFSLKALGPLFQRTPLQTNPTIVNQVGVLSNLSATLNSMCSFSKALVDYLSFELDQGTYFAIVSSDIVIRLGNSIDSGLTLLGQLIISLPPQSRFIVFDTQNRHRVLDMLGSLRTICNAVQQHSSDETVIKCFERVLVTCNTIPERYFAMPVFPEAEQPDQTLERPDDPQDMSRSS